MSGEPIPRFCLDELEDGLGEHEALEWLSEALRHPKIVLVKSLSFVTNSSWHIDIAFGWQEILVLLECLTPHCSAVEYKIDYTSVPEIALEIEPSDRDAIRAFFVDVMFDHWIDGAGCAYWEAAWEIHGKIMEGKQICHPRIAENYIANYINDDSGNMSIESGPPEWQHGFWRSPTGATVGVDAYMSPDSWFISYTCSSFDPTALERYIGALGIPPRVTDKAMLLFHNEHGPMCLSGSAAYRVPMRVLEATRQSAGEILGLSHDHALLSTKTHVRVCSTSETIAVATKDIEICVPVHRIATRELDPVLRDLLPWSGPLDWEQISESTFEELGYDILIELGYDKVRRMGTVNTPDGGRDLIAVRQRFQPLPNLGASGLSGGVKKKWIFQCKFTKREQIAWSDVGSILEVVCHYHADAYGIITNAVAAPNIYDRLEAFKKNERHPYFEDYEVFSKHEVERLLSNNPRLRAKYFCESRA